MNRTDRSRIVWAAVMILALAGQWIHAQNTKFFRTLNPVTNAVAQSCWQAGDDPAINDLTVTVQANAVNWRDDGTAPIAASTGGNLASVGSTLGFHTVWNAQHFQAIATTGSAILNCNMGRP